MGAPYFASTQSPDGVPLGIATTLLNTPSPRRVAPKYFHTLDVVRPFDIPIYPYRVWPTVSHPQEIRSLRPTGSQWGFSPNPAHRRRTSAIPCALAARSCCRRSSWAALSAPRRRGDGPARPAAFERSAYVDFDISDFVNDPPIFPPANPTGFVGGAAYAPRLYGGLRRPIARPHFYLSRRPIAANSI